MFRVLLDPLGCLLYTMGQWYYFLFVDNVVEKNQLAAAQSEIEAKQQHLNERQVAVTDMENRARYYGAMPSPLRRERQLKKKLLLADPGLDLELAKKMNNVGYSENNYNKDKHRQRPPVHKYAVIGDPLEHGMDFSIHQTETHEKYSGHAPPSAERFYRSLRQHRSAPLVTVKGAIPANIKAKYGSKLVEELFADEQAVDRVKQQMEREMIRQQMRHQRVRIQLTIIIYFSKKLILVAGAICLEARDWLFLLINIDNGYASLL